MTKYSYKTWEYTTRKKSLIHWTVPIYISTRGDAAHCSEIPPQSDEHSERTEILKYWNDPAISSRDVGKKRATRADARGS